MDFVDDVDFVACPAGAHRDVLPQLADFVDAPVAGAVDFQDIDVVARADALAQLAGVAGRWRGALDAVERFGQKSEPPRFFLLRVRL